MFDVLHDLSMQALESNLKRGDFVKSSLYLNISTALQNDESIDEYQFQALVNLVRRHLRDLTEEGKDKATAELAELEAKVELADYIPIQETLQSSIC